MVFCRQFPSSGTALDKYSSYFDQLALKTLAAGEAHKLTADALAPLLTSMSTTYTDSFD